jgi:purine nucleosidase
MLDAYAALDPLLHDACPVACLLDPSLFAGKRCAASVDWREGLTEGQLLAWPSESSYPTGQGWAQVITEVDCSRLLDLTYERISQLP